MRPQASHQGTTITPTLQRLLTAACAAVLALAGVRSQAQAFAVTNIISDGSVPAQTTDPGFINPWGISASPTWWISAQGTGLNYVVPPAGTVAFKVVVPLAVQPTMAGLPAGSVTTAGSTGFLLPNGTAPSFFFSTLDGTISGWNSKLGTNGAVSQIVVNNSATGAAYTGLALLNTAGGSFLLAPNFSSGSIDVYNSTYQVAKLAGSFTDPNLPSAYFPFSIHVLGTQIYVAYAQHASATPPFREMVAAGSGIVDIFDTAGNFVSRAVSGGNLNAPWGVAIAPANFGIYSNDLLIGNFGDGKINVYDPKTFSYVGQLMDATGKSLAFASLWDLLTGGTAVAGTTAVSGGSTSSVYFSAGLTGEIHGLFGSIANSTTAGTPTFGFTSASSATSVKAGNSATINLSVAPVNGFSGTVAFTCTGLPVGATCSFSPNQLTVSASAASVGTVTVNTTAASAALAPNTFNGAKGLATSLALLLPLASLLGLRQKRRMQSSALRVALHIVFVIAVFGSLAAAVGCADSSTVAVPVTPTPAGTSNIVVNASSGSISSSTTIAVTVQ